MRPTDGNGCRQPENRVLTFTMKAMVLAILVCVFGLTFGVAGLIANWQWAKMVGAASAITLGVGFWLSTDASGKTMDRLLYGPNEKK